MLISYSLFLLVFVVAILAIRCPDLRPNCTEPIQLAALIEAQSIGRIVNNQHHRNTASNTEAGEIRTDTVLFEGMNDISKSSKEPFPATYIHSLPVNHVSASSLSASPATTLGQFHYSTNNVVVTNKFDFTSTLTSASHSAPDLHIHHHHYIISNKKTNPPSVHHTNMEESPNNINYQSLPDTVWPNVVAPDHFNYMSDGNSIKSNLNNSSLEIWDPNRSNNAQFDNVAPDTIDNADIDLRSENDNNYLGDLLDNKTDRVLDLSPIASEDHTAQVYSTSPTSENENSAYGVPLN